MWRKSRVKGVWQMEIITKRNILGVIIMLIAVGVTLMVFFSAVKERETIHYVALMFMVLAEVITAGGIILIGNYHRKTSAALLVAGGFSALIIYIIVSLVVSIVFLAGISTSITLLANIQVILIAIVAVTVILLTMANKHAKKQDAKVAEARDSHTPKRGGI